MTSLLDMKQKETAHKIAVMQAFLEGKVILCWDRRAGHANAEPIKYPSWDWAHYDYEVASNEKV